MPVKTVARLWSGEIDLNHPDIKKYKRQRDEEQELERFKSKIKECEEALKDLNKATKKLKKWPRPDGSKQRQHAKKITQRIQNLYKSIAKTVTDSQPDYSEWRKSK